ncbi:MAG: ABC transporter permease [Chloroflexi bacterium]|nr:ABC transporter permease [Chloroflexota bacterium]
MRDTLRLYLRYLGISIRSQLQYRASFIMLSIGTFLTTAAEFVGVAALFDRFGNLRGWTLAEVALFYGIANISFALAEAWARGFDTFAGMVKSGEFDRVLLRPRSTALQVAGQELQLMRVGRLFQGLLVLVWSAAALSIPWTISRIALLLAAILGGACLFTGLFILQATLCFWTVDSIEIVNTVTYGGVETARFPIIIYRDWFRRFFTFIVPMACITYFPALAILGRPDPLGTPHWLQSLAPLVGLVFLLVALRVWQVGVRHYRSTGS